jgi:hypothetical protein
MICDERVWIVKAHHPGQMPMNLRFDANKIITCVRNPLDIMVSYAALVNTLSHSNKPAYDIHEAYPEWWDFWVRHQTLLIKKYFNLILKHCDTEEKCPIQFVRYEDLVADIRKPTKDLMEFVLEIDSIEGTNAERRIEAQAELGAAASSVY